MTKASSFFLELQRTNPEDPPVRLAPSAILR